MKTRFLDLSYPAQAILIMALSFILSPLTPLISLYLNRSSDNQINYLIVISIGVISLIMFVLLLFARVFTEKTFLKTLWIYLTYEEEEIERLLSNPKVYLEDARDGSKAVWNEFISMSLALSILNTLYISVLLLSVINISVITLLIFNITMLIFSAREFE